MRKWFSPLLVALGVAIAAHSAHAQPSLKMMIPANPGGGWDQTGRALATHLGETVICWKEPPHEYWS